MSKNDYLYPPLPLPRLDTYVLEQFYLHRRDPIHEARCVGAIVERRLLSTYKVKISNRNSMRFA